MTTNPSSRLLARAVGLFVAPLLVTLVLSLSPHITYAATITVDGATCTLPDAITAANTDGATGGCTAGSGADTLLLTAPLYSLAIGPYHTRTVNVYDYGSDRSATPSISTTIVISGGIDGAIVERSGSDPYRLFDVEVAGDLTIQHVTIRYGNATPLPGGFYDPTVYGFGGGIANRGTLTLVDSQLFSNTAPHTGGGIYNHDRGIVNLINVTLIANVAGYEGGGFASQGTAILTSTLFISNTAEHGGGFSNRYGSESFSETSKAILNNSDFFSNTAHYGGGGLSNSGTFGSAQAIVELTNVNFIANVAHSGGGLDNSDTSTAIISNTNFISNNAQFGGAMSIGGWYGSWVILTNSHVISNNADYGGGISLGDVSPFAATARVSIFDSELRANRAVYSGGAIHQYHSVVSIVRSLIVDNWAGQTGGALLRTPDWPNKGASETLIEQSCFVNNTHTAIMNESYVPIHASHNWWGAVDGPTGVGSGHGESVSGTVTYAPFLTSAILSCPTTTTIKSYLPDVEQ